MPVLATAVAFGSVGLAVARVVVQAATLEAHNTANVVVVVLVLVVVVVVVVVRGSVHVHGAPAMSHVSATSSTVGVSSLVSLSHRDVHVRVVVGGRRHVASHVVHVAHVALEVAWRRAVAELVAAVAGHMSKHATVVAASSSCSSVALETDGWAVGLNMSNSSA